MENVVGPATVEAFYYLEVEVKEEHDPLEVKEPATPWIKEEVEEAQLETTGKAFFSNFLLLSLSSRVIKFCHFLL